MKKSVIIGIVIGIVLLIVTGYFLLNKSVNYYSCEEDYDCVTLNSGCCGCNVGGGVVSINRNFEEEWNAKIKISCMNIPCSDKVMPMDPTCSSKSICKNNKCELDTSCVKEGEYYGGMTYSPDYRECCEGLTSVYSGLQFDNRTGKCDEGPTDGPVICIKCGDGICGKGENKCNCASDCEENSTYKCYYNFSSCQNCKTDSDCKINCNFCINTNESYEIPPNVLAAMGVPAPCPANLSCKCVNNKCSP